MVVGTDRMNESWGWNGAWTEEEEPGHIESHWEKEHHSETEEFWIIGI